MTAHPISDDPLAERLDETTAKLVEQGYDPDEARDLAIRAEISRRYAAERRARRESVAMRPSAGRSGL